jgi:hypothetical protein
MPSRLSVVRDAMGLEDLEQTIAEDDLPTMPGIVRRVVRPLEPLEPSLPRPTPPVLRRASDPFESAVGAPRSTPMPKASSPQAASTPCSVVRPTAAKAAGVRAAGVRAAYPTRSAGPAHAAPPAQAATPARTAAHAPRVHPSHLSAIEMAEWAAELRMSRGARRLLTIAAATAVFAMGAALAAIGAPPPSGWVPASQAATTTPH